MHGGSGLSCDEYRASIEGGVRKINYYTYADKAGLEAAPGRCSRPSSPTPMCSATTAVAATKAIEANLDDLVRCLYRVV